MTQYSKRSHHQKWARTHEHVKPHFNPRLRAYAIINKAFPRGSDNVEAAALLQEYPDHWTYVDTPIGNRKAFSNAFGGGYAVTEYQPKDSKAIAEIRALYRYVFDTY